MHWWKFLSYHSHLSLWSNVLFPDENEKVEQKIFQFRMLNDLLKLPMKLYNNMVFRDWREEMERRKKFQQFYSYRKFPSIQFHSSGSLFCIMDDFFFRVDIVHGCWVSVQQHVHQSSTNYKLLFYSFYWELSSFRSRAINNVL